jgi:hypothetical protein
MTDPTDGMVSFQQALLDGEIELRPGELDPNLFVHSDNPTPGVLRLTYVKLDGKTVKAFVVAVTTPPMNGLPCLQLGVAVPEKYRNKGCAKDILKAAIAEMEHGFARTKMSSFYVEGIVSVDNEPSKRASAATISSTPTPVTDDFSGLPALQYVRKIG